MTRHTSRNYYEDLLVSPNADVEMIERAFRLLAKRYHPDNKGAGDAEQFDVIYNAYQILRDPEKRAAYDAAYAGKCYSNPEVTGTSPDIDINSAKSDALIRQGVLSLLYMARRRDTMNPGVGIVELEKTLDCSQSQMSFHIWYLKEKGWIFLDENGAYAITAKGVDKVTDDDLPLRIEHLARNS